MILPLPITCIILTFAFAWLRIAGHKSQTFQAFAHIYVAVLFSAWWFTGGMLALTSALALCAVECFRSGYDRAGGVRAVLLAAGVMLMILTAFIILEGALRSDAMRAALLRQVEPEATPFNAPLDNFSVPDYLR